MQKKGTLAGSFSKKIRLVAEPFMSTVRAGGLVAECGVPGGIIVVIKEIQAAFGSM